jgi:hypothetical protein
MLEVDEIVERFKIDVVIFCAQLSQVVDCGSPQYNFQFHWRPCRELRCHSRKHCAAPIQWHRNHLIMICILPEMAVGVGIKQNQQ